MAVSLPSSPAPRSVTARLLSKRRDIEPLFGGPASRIQRLGTKWAIDVDLPPMHYSDAMNWIAALAKADGGTVVLHMPQPGFDPGDPGAPLINGAGQLGKSINLDGFGSYAVRAGQYFSLIIGGQRFLYMVTANKSAASGAMTGLPIEPMVRRSPPDNTVAEFAEPKIEGFLTGREASWTVDVARTVGLSFTITERE